MDSAGYGRYTYWRDLLNGTKPFGERAARKIEASIEGMTRGCLDGDSSNLSPRAVLLGIEFDRLPTGDLKEAIYERFKRVLEDTLRGVSQPAPASESEPPELPVAPKQKQPADH